MTGRKRVHDDNNDEEKVMEEALILANEILEEGEAKELWQVGKRMKALVDVYDTTPRDIMSEGIKCQLSSVYFVWGSALARIACRDEDDTLAAAAGKN